MKKLLNIIGASVCFVILSYGNIQAAEGDWGSYRPFFQAIRDTNTMIENTLTFLALYQPSIGWSYHATTVAPAADYDEMAIKMSAGTSYAYLLEVWTKRTNWMKAMEYSFDDSSSGVFIWEPYALSTVYTEGTMDKLIIDHTASERTMTWEVIFSASDATTDRLIANLVQANNVLDVSMTAHLKLDVSGDVALDAYLMGAKISLDSPYRATLKCGVEDIGDDYNNDFKYHGFTIPQNAALFDSSGFKTDGNSDGSWDGYTFPDPSTILSSDLPTAAEVNNISISFSNSEDTPDFI